MGVVTATTVMSYALYTISEETIAKFHTPNLIFTIPFVLYGIFRYLYLVHQKVEGGRPEEILLTDRPLLLAVMGWTITVLVVPHPLKNIGRSPISQIRNRKIYEH